MATIARLSAVLDVGAQISLSAALGGGATRFGGALAAGQTLDLTAVFNAILGLTGWSLPSGFPALTLDTATVSVTLAQGATPGAISVTAGSDQVYSNLLGLQGVTITHWGLSLNAGGASKDIGFTLGASLGGHALSGFVAFDGGDFTAIGVTSTASWAVGDLLGWIAPGVDWGDLLPISFSPQSSTAPMRLYHGGKAGTDGYLPGFNLDQTRIDILGFVADVSAQVDKGLTVTGALPSPIKIEILEITGKTDAVGPSVSAQTGGGFTLEAGFVFAGSRFVDGEVTVQKGTAGAYEFAATITYDGGGLPFPVPPLAFTYTQSDGFQVAGWNLPNFPGPEALVQEIQKAIQQHGQAACGSLVDLVFQETVTTKFDVSVGMARQNGQFGVSLTCSYTLTVLGQSLTVDAPSFVVPLTPAPTSFSDLLDWLIDRLGDAVVNLAEALANDPVKTVEFLGMVVAPKVLKKLATTLICRGYPTNGGGGGGGGGGGSGGSGLPPGPGWPAGGGGGGGGATPSTPTITSLSYVAGEFGEPGALSVAWTPATNASGYVAGFCLLPDTANPVVSVTTQETSVSIALPSPLSPAPAQYVVLVFANDGPTQGVLSTPWPISALDAPTGLTAVRDAGQVDVSWNLVEGADSYEARLTGASYTGPVVLVSSPRTGLPLPPSDPRAAYTASVVARMADGSAIASALSTIAVPALPPPPPPPPPPPVGPVAWLDWSDGSADSQGIENVLAKITGALNAQASWATMSKPVACDARHTPARGWLFYDPAWDETAIPKTISGWTYAVWPSTQSPDIIAAVMSGAPLPAGGTLSSAQAVLSQPLMANREDDGNEAPNQALFYPIVSDGPEQDRPLFSPTAWRCSTFSSGEGGNDGILNVFEQIQAGLGKSPSSAPLAVKIVADDRRHGDACGFVYFNDTASAGDLTYVRNPKSWACATWITSDALDGTANRVLEALNGAPLPDGTVLSWAQACTAKVVFTNRQDGWGGGATFCIIYPLGREEKSP
ncbi:hypothetical protein [Myxococcus qinghaiensis]|uniref:hypothetical protein n=1 Tax=Myxococcus qinghaiensis TaxID=2906758 RepID=UPI0020A714DB|nr:hypothetical protein [Myxococcus qinghaiensis]MCP3167863.1 hypothetical protein [Myxococcus qinghaiensis]